MQSRLNREHWKAQMEEREFDLKLIYLFIKMSMEERVEAVWDKYDFIGQGQIEKHGLSELITELLGSKGEKEAEKYKEEALTDSA